MFFDRPIHTITSMPHWISQEQFLYAKTSVAQLQVSNKLAMNRLTLVAVLNEDNIADKVQIIPTVAA